MQILQPKLRLTVAVALTHSCLRLPIPALAELIKLARFAPGARTLLRIRADDPGARCQLGNKYGAEVRWVEGP